LSESPTRTFYRVAKTFPPTDQDYTTASERRNGAPPPPYIPLDRHRSWYEGYSAFDTQEAAVRLAIRMRGKLGKVIVRYDVPEGVGITWESVPGDEDTGHFDLFGDKNVLKRYLATDFRLEIEGAGRAKSGGEP
jgi:hypothetical protein